MSANESMRPRPAANHAPPPAPLIDTTGMSPSSATMADVLNDVAAPFQTPPDPKKGALGQIERGIGAVMGVVGAPFQLLDTGFALATASVAALMPGFPAATLLAPHLGALHGHLHPPSLIPPSAVIPLPSIGTVMCAGCVSVLIGGIPAARAGDVGLAVLCFSTAPAFEIYTGSSNTFIGGSRAARMLDITRHCNPASALGKLGAALGAVGVVAGAVGAGASAAAGEALQASMQAAQAAADAAALAMSALLGKDPGVPPALGAVMLGNPTVLIGGFPLPDLLEVLGALLKGLKKLGALAGSSPRVRKALARLGVCHAPGEPVEPFTGVVFNDFEDYRDPDGFVWERHYRSSWSDDDGPLGHGFRHFYQRRLTLLRKEAVYEAHDGEQVFIPRDEGGAGFVADGGFRLERHLDGTHVLLTDRDELLYFLEQPSVPKSARLVRFRNDALDVLLTYDEQGRLSALREREGGDPIDTTLEYDAAGRIAALRRGRRFHEPRTICRYDYADGCLVTWHDALGARAHMRYDARRRMIQGTDRRGYSFHWHYDARSGRCIRAHGDDGLWGIEADYQGSQSVFKEPDGGEWTFKHYPDGVISHRLDPEGGMLEYVRDERGRVVEQLLPGGRRFAWLYDADGLHYGRADAWGNQFAPEDDDPEPADPFEPIEPASAKQWLWGAPLERLPASPGLLTAPILRELEQLGLPRPGEAPPLPEPRRDGLGRPLELIGASGVIERYQYDPEGNVVAVQDCHGHWSRRQIESWNLLGAEISALGHATRYEYTHRAALRAVVDPASHRTDYVRDRLGRVREEHRLGALWRTRRHDPNDVVIEERDAQGMPLVSVRADAAGLPEEVRLASGEVYRFEHDEQGRLLLASSSQHEVTLRHWRELRCADQRDGLGVEHVFESWLGVHRSIYFGRFVVDYDYGAGPGVRILTPDGAEHRVHGGGGGLVVRHNGNGTSEASVFDDAERLCARVCWPRERPHAGSSWSERYRYSAAGELELWIDSNTGPTQLEYDADHRLIRCRGAAGELAYEYDAAGNLVSAPGAEDVEHDGGNRIRRANLALYEHDSQERISRVQRPLGGVRYDYDSRGQLIGARWDDRAETWTAAYDGLGRRIWRQYGTERTDFYWDGDRLAAERFPDGRLRLYVYVNEAALVPFCFIDYESEQAAPATGRAHYVYAAPSGMPLRVEDRDGRVVWQVKTLHPFGRIELEPRAQLELCLRFAGHYHDAHLDLHYNRFRDYDPWLGRYLQPDPIGHDGGINLYAYPRNPLVEVDLRGLFHKARRKAQRRAKQRKRRKEKAERDRARAIANSQPVTCPPRRAPGGVPPASINDAMQRAHAGAQAGNIGAGYHGDERHNFSPERARDVILFPERVYVSDGGARNLIYYQNGDIVVVQRSNAHGTAGEAITGYGKTGTLGPTGAQAVNAGGQPPMTRPARASDPGRPVSPTEIENGTVPGGMPSATQVWP